jgi:hypothetical protein
MVGSVFFAAVQTLTCCRDSLNDNKIIDVLAFASVLGSNACLTSLEYGTFSLLCFAFSFLSCFWYCRLGANNIFDIGDLAINLGDNTSLLLLEFGHAFKV